MFSDAACEPRGLLPPHLQARLAVPFYTSATLGQRPFTNLPIEVLRHIVLCLLEEDEELRLCYASADPDQPSPRLPSSLDVMPLLGVSRSLRRCILAAGTDLFGVIRLGQRESASLSTSLMRQHCPRVVTISRPETSMHTAALSDSWARVAFGLVHWGRFPGPLDALTALVVSLGDDLPLRLVWAVLSLQRSCFRLQKLSIRARSPSLSLTPPPFPLSNLQHLLFHRVQLYQPASLLTFLHSTPALRTLILSGCENLDVDLGPDGHSPERTVTLNSLRQLRIDNSAPFVHPAVSCLRAPNIEMISLIGPTENTFGAWASYLPHDPDGSVAVSQLKSLELCTDDRWPTVADSPVEEFVSLLDSVPSLQRLHIRGLSDPLGVVPSALVLPSQPSSRVRLPVLSQLSFGASRYAFRQDPMIDSRTDPNRIIPTVLRLHEHQVSRASARLIQSRGVEFLSAKDEPFHFKNSWSLDDLHDLEDTYDQDDYDPDYYPNSD